MASRESEQLTALLDRAFYDENIRSNLLKTRFTDRQIMAILKQHENGVSVADLAREHGFSTAMIYQWRSKFGGIDASLMQRMKELEAENARLKKMYAEERIKAEIRKEALAGEL